MKDRTRKASSIGVVLVLATCGLLMTTSARIANGTQLRTESSSLADIINERSNQGRKLDEQIAQSRARIAEMENSVSGGDDSIVRARRKSDTLANLARSQQLKGPGLQVTLDDAPPEAANLDGVGPNDLLIHQQDLEGVMNALWAGGARGMTIQGNRIVATSSVKCVGNTLRINSRVYSPPYVIAVVGDQDKLQTALDESAAVNVYRDYAKRLGLGWKVERTEVSMDAYDGAVQIDQAKVK